MTDADKCPPEMSEMTDTDRELLELAAKAAGIEHGADRLDCGLSITLPDGRHYSLPRWNPLVDDGDALRLAVKIGNELAPFHPDASHVEPGYRDGWNACYWQADGDRDRLRAAVTALVPIVQRDRELIGECDEYRAERDAALRLADEAMGERAA